MHPYIADILERLDVPGERMIEYSPLPLEFHGLTDLTAVPFVTIDNEGSRDLDQALHIERESAGWRVRYAIADASWFVRPGTAVFEYALDRGASYYLPGMALPMLPRALSEGTVSLNPDVDRRAVVFDMTVGTDGEALRTELVRAKVRSRAKLTYDGVQAWFDDGAPDGVEWARSVRLLQDVGESRAARARTRGVIEYDRTEAEVRLHGDRFVLEHRERNDVERWNEQISLLCNTEGARLMKSADAKLDDLQSVYRVHLPPLRRRLDQLRDQLNELCERNGLADIWWWDGQQQLAEYLRELPDEPRRLRRAIELQVRYTNRASEYADRVGPHFALAVEQYARFSAPMREIVGVFTHKEALEALGVTSTDHADDEVVRTAVIDAGNAARRLQKRIDKEVMLRAIGDLLREDLASPNADRPWREGTVVGTRASRLYVLADEPAVDLKVYVDDLPGDWRLDGYSLTDGERLFGIGDGVALRVVDYDESRRRFVFEIRRI